MDLVLSIAKEIPLVNTLWNSIFFWQIIVLMVVLIIGGIFVFRKKLIIVARNILLRPKMLEHDRERYLAVNKIMTEEHLNNFLDGLTTNDAYRIKNIYPIYSLLKFSELTSNEFIITKIQEKFLDTCNAIRNLTEFLEIEFFVYPNNFPDDNHQLCLRPNLNPDREGAFEDYDKYHQYQIKLDALIIEVRGKYRDFRMSVKGTLII